LNKDSQHIIRLAAVSIEPLHEAAESIRQKIINALKGELAACREEIRETRTNHLKITSEFELVRPACNRQALLDLHPLLFAGEGGRGLTAGKGAGNDSPGI